VLASLFLEPTRHQQGMGWEQELLPSYGVDGSRS
jgi:hypothetical protein